MVRGDGARPLLGITAGDPAGIGPEIAVKALLRPGIFEKAAPVLYCDRAVLEDAAALAGKPCVLRALKDPREAAGKPGTIDYIDAGFLERGDYVYGRTGVKPGEASFRYVVSAIADAMSGRIDGVVTGPISKEAVNMAGHHFSGHTEIFAHYTGTKKYGMLLSAGGGVFSGSPGGLNVIHVTTHVSLRRACALITKERVLDTIRLAGSAMTLMGKKSRRIGVAGLNPHASENGLFGKEEARAIVPAVMAARAEGLDVQGPVPPDTVFVKALGGLFDVVVAMYHDQGHIPLKLFGFRMDAPGNFSRVSGVNATIGLPVIRTSVDHGTAFDIAGKNLANEESMIDAVYMAAVFAENRPDRLLK
ncbi:MAG: 4-hydroxythreonine-4-phosphate dehydrogenase PdxA [Treponema sp.]|jgi:4-hydroxythreonine-4-phosphate dehydrogenase|nr:4-hydroxythreonine-4-phosphate dehydrogenase PdxA [Treponema sp.]